MELRQRLAERTPPPARAALHALLETGRRVGYLRARYRPPLGTRPPVALAVCAVFRNEARYLAEWVTFHRLQGVERFWLYDNLSTDDWESALAPELASGIATVTPWRAERFQESAYADCLERHRDSARWIAFIDIDEFLFSPTGRSLPDVLRGFDMHPAVVANWRLYGTSGYEESPPGLVIESYPMRGRDDHRDNRWVKSIVCPRKSRVSTTIDAVAHAFAHRGLAVGEDRRPVTGGVREPATADLLRINHYIAKSARAWDRKRTQPGYGGTALVPADEVRDEILLRFAPAVREALAGRTSGRADPAANSRGGPTPPAAPEVRNGTAVSIRAASRA